MQNETWREAFSGFLSLFKEFEPDLPANTEHTTRAPKLSSFGNWVTGLILFTILTLVIGGTLIAITVSLWGIAAAMLGILAWWAGDTELPPDPRTAGMLTFWDNPIMALNELGGISPIVVGGRTILAPYFPFFIDVVRFEITNVDKEFPMTILSGGIGEDGRPLDPVPLEGHVSVTLRVNVYDSLDYIQAGKMDKIFTQINDIVYEQTKALARLNKPETIASTSEVISGPLRLHLQGNVFEQNSFGVDIVKVQARFDLPEEILEALKESGAEKYQRTGELAEYETDTIGAVKLQARLEADPRMAGRGPGLG